MGLTLGEWFWRSFEWLKDPLPVYKPDRDEKICEECFDVGFEKGREFERKEIEQYLVKKDDPTTE